MSKLFMICAALAIAGGVARADDHDPDMQGPPTKDPVRTGATVTLAVGPGELHIIPDSGSETRIEGAAFSLRVGTAISQSAALELMIDFVDGSGSRSSIFGGSVKVYQSNALFLRFGGGLGLMSTASTDMTSGMSTTSREWGAAGVFGIGYEWFQLQDIGLFGEFDVEANRLLSPSGADATIGNAQLVFGITWY